MHAQISAPLRIHLQYGLRGLDIELPAPNVTVLQPKFLPGLADEREEFLRSVRKPIESAPLRDLIRPEDRVALVIPDITRPLPRERLLPWLFEELSHVPAENFVIINGTGSHRGNTTEELAEMVGQAVASEYRIVNHDAHDPSTMTLAGKSRDSRPVYLNREYFEADKRIVIGFIEPHFMAGFSGGYKGIFPALADIDSIMHYHRASVIGDPASTWGVLEGNPTQEQIRFNGALLPLHFCINVTLNRKKEITRFFSGAILPVHDQGCAFGRETAMVRSPFSYPIVITTNGGYPLDQNLYQAVKGMSAGAQIVSEGGLVLAASRCNDGFPSHGNFRKLLFEHATARELLETILAPGFSMYDQWEAQLLAIIRMKARVGLFSEIPPAEVRRAHLDPVDDIEKRVIEELDSIGRDSKIAVLPEGPMTIPYLAEGSPAAPGM